MRSLPLYGCWAGILLASCGWSRPPARTLPTALPQPPTRASLRSPDDFRSLSTSQERSKALFAEMNRVLSHPRCTNCHPEGDSPRQTMTGKIHDPPVTRGSDDRGVVGMECSSCHQAENLPYARVPGAPKWHVAPREMAWVGKSAAQLCQQLKDPKRNGGKTLQQIQEHMAHDALVAWGWNPGHHREPAPGTQEEMGKLTAAWIETGAFCPEDIARGGTP